MAEDVEMIRRKGEEIGLKLNEKKCEFISSSAISTEPVFRSRTLSTGGCKTQNFSVHR